MQPILKKSKTVLVTGGAGFIAHHMIAHTIRHTDWSVISLDRLDFSGNLNRLQDIMMEFSPQDQARVRVIYHDLRAEINSMLSADIGPVDYILHLAASSHVDRSIARPMEFVMDNVVGTVNLLQFARTQPALEKFVYFSTDEIFGPAPIGVAYSERDRYNSTNPYSASKAAGEEMCVAFENTYNLPIVITHTMNVFGERQHPEKFVPLCIRRIQAGEEVLIHSNKERTVAGSRHYIHAEDVAAGVMFILALDSSMLPQDFGGAKCPKFNLVGPEEIDNLTLAQTIAQVIGKPLNYQLVDFHSSRPGHDLRYALSGEYMRDLGWHPRLRLQDRIAQVVNWTLANDRWIKI
jgi:dTDP-glucose 4,6-dehydratase